MRTSPSRQDPGARERERVWGELFTSPVHLDSAIAHAPPGLKARLAQVMPRLLRQPVSLARALGVPLRNGEPWTLTPEELVDWAPARKLGRALDALDEREAADLPVATLADFPPWMTEEWVDEWGEAAARRLAGILGAAPPLTLRVSRREDRLNVLAELDDGEHGGAITARAPFGLCFPGYVRLQGSRAREAGSFEIQDEGSQVMAQFALDPGAVASVLGDAPAAAPRSVSWPRPPAPAARTIVDACAGAGGKTLALADLLGGRGRVFAYDVSERKLQALRRRASRAGLRNIQGHAVPEGDELAGLERFRGTADVVLVDAPCTGWGVLKRNPDIKWRQLPDELERLPALQARLLRTYAELVRPGGTLIFGLCSFRRAESLATVAAFGGERPDFGALGGGYFGPDPGSDGFYMHAWRRDGA